MDTMKVAALVEALRLVGRVWRNKDGSQPAEAVKKVLQQLDGAGEATVVEWVAGRGGEAGKRRGSKRPAKVAAAKMTEDQAVARLEAADTQAALREAVAGITLAADQWKSLARTLTGRSMPSGKAAKEAIETHFSDRLLLNERIESVRRQFAAPDKRPARA